MRNRSELIDNLRTAQMPDVLIIGGGINGVGVFRELAAQGVPALLVEAGDFSSGTSAAPSRLIHGGLRYLETGEAGLVREALLERNLLLRNARHMVKPLPVWVPLKSWFGGTFSAGLRFFGLKKTPGKKGAVPLAIGLRIYDLFGRTHKSMPNHRMMRAATARAEIPELSPDLIAVGEFYDARIIHPERLVLELIEDAENDCSSSIAVPYVAAGKIKDGAVTLCDRLTGETFKVSPKLVINASGAWVDQVQSDLNIGGRLMGGTRGTHLVMRNPEIAKGLGGRMLYFETHDFRACLALRLDENHVYIGTTDVRTDDPNDTRFTEAEIDYIFDVMKPILPNVEWRREDAVFVMAGIRPLPYQDDQVKAAGAISRDHRIERFAATAARPFETLTLVGGKWTTYRAFAEQVAAQVLSFMSKVAKTDTKSLEIGGAKGLPDTANALAAWVDNLAAKTGISAARAAQLTQRYGSTAAKFASADDTRQFKHQTAYAPAEIEVICKTERVTKLQDIVLRRTLMAFEGLTSREIIEELGEVVAQCLGWDDLIKQEQIADTVSVLINQHRVPVA